MVEYEDIMKDYDYEYEGWTYEAMTSPPTAMRFVWLILLAFIVRFIKRSWLRMSRRKRARAGLDCGGKLMVVLGSGGHTAEALEMLRHVAASGMSFKEIIYVVAKTDNHSQTKATSKHREHFKAVPMSFRTTPRAREVGQSYFSSIFTTLHALLYALAIVPLSRPSLLLVNGPGTCVPVALSAAFFNMFLLTNCSTIFVESVARVKLLYPVVERFIVQWSDLLQKYPACEYHGRLV